MASMPTLFIPHGGGPCFFMEWNPPDTWHSMAAYLRGVPDDLPDRPQAIIVISAHWESATVTIQHNPSPPLLFDYQGFPAHTYQITYPAAGSPQLAGRIADLLTAAGIASTFDFDRGFDHGVFVPLKIAFPAADIPIVQVSLQAGFDPAGHLALGRALHPLREEGVLILGSGMSYHNMRTLMRNMHGGGPVAPDSELFDAWLTEVLTRRTPAARDQALINWETAPAARKAHPREEHLLPLLVVCGAAASEPGKKMLSDTVMGAMESAFQFN